MTLDSKDSDIEQLRSQLQALHIGLDSSSIGSGPGDTEADDGFPGIDSFSPYIYFCLKYKSIDGFKSCNWLCSWGKIFVISLREHLLLRVGVQMTV